MRHHNKDLPSIQTLADSSRVWMAICRLIAVGGFNYRLWHLVTQIKVVKEKDDEACHDQSSSAHR